MARRAGARRARQQRTPWPILPLAAIAVAYVAVPFVALLQRAPWSDLGGLLGRSIVIDALRLSITTALAATGLAMLLGIPLAWVLARTRFPGRSVARALVTLPMVLPPVVGGAALLAGRPGCALPSMGYRSWCKACCRASQHTDGRRDGRGAWCW